MLAFAFTQGFELILYRAGDCDGRSCGVGDSSADAIVKDRYQFRDVIAHVLTFDYLGALGSVTAVSGPAGAASWLCAPPCCLG